MTEHSMWRTCLHWHSQSESPPSVRESVVAEIWFVRQIKDVLMKHLRQMCQHVLHRHTLRFPFDVYFCCCLSPDSDFVWGSVCLWLLTLSGVLQYFLSIFSISLCFIDLSFLPPLMWYIKPQYKPYEHSIIDWYWICLFWYFRRG